jgi:DNA-binding FrmR family transcriptional regulator
MSEPDSVSTRLHESHPRLLARLRRAEGHLRATIAMMEAGRSCLDLAAQLHAVERAIGSAKRELIHDHIDHCLAEGPADLAELKAITRHL